MIVIDNVEAYYQDTITYRRKFHMHPELSAQISQTSKYVQELLSAWKIPLRSVMEVGIIAEIDSGRAGRTIALRADMDALPIAEQSDTCYCSTVEGVGHLCGHDCHTASLLTAARILNEHKSGFSGKVRLLFQPAEEAPGCGAKEMIDNGAMDGVDAVFGVHMYNHLDVGTVSVQAGPRMAASLRGSIEITGVGGHGGEPHQCIDPIVAGSAVVMNLQTISSRELDMQDSAVITVGMFHSGTSQFAVADKAELKMTIKFFNASLAKQLKENIIRIVKGTASTFRTKCNVMIDGFLPPVTNDACLAAIAENSAEKLYGKNCVVQCPAWSASEDFGKYMEKAPGVFAFIGGRNQKKGIIHTAHHPQFDVDEDALKLSSGLYAQFAIDYLNTRRNKNE